MSAVWIILAVVAVVGVIAVVARLRRRGPGRAPEVPSAETTAGRAAQEAVARGEGAAAPAVGSSGGAAPELAAAATEAPAEAVALSGAEPVEEELKSRVEALLQDSEHMLAELRRAAADSGRRASPAIAGSVEVLEEGLQEIRALAQRKQWSQAREKGEALRAQLSLMLPTSPGKRAS